MARVTDPVCGMTVDSDNAPAKSTYSGETYYFCSVACREAFDANPDRYTTKARAPLADMPQHDAGRDAPFTKAGGLVTPKFGSAGSGGAEFENRPEK